MDRGRSGRGRRVPESGDQFAKGALMIFRCGVQSRQRLRVMRVRVKSGEEERRRHNDEDERGKRRRPPASATEGHRELFLQT